MEEIIPFFGVPEALLSDQGKNLLSNLMHDVCDLLGTKKLNTTSYHPQCDGLVKSHNRTLKTALRKHAADNQVTSRIVYSQVSCGLIGTLLTSRLMRNHPTCCLGMIAACHSAQTILATASILLCSFSTNSP